LANGCFSFGEIGWLNGLRTCIVLTWPSALSARRISKPFGLAHYFKQLLSFALSQDAIMNDLRCCFVVLRGLESFRWQRERKAFNRPEANLMKRFAIADFGLNLIIKPKSSAEM
ncbi:MAG: hypothetical protein ACTS80_00800, partial [Candidatus Hodgkinia cicadicola]